MGIFSDIFDPFAALHNNDAAREREAKVKDKRRRAAERSSSIVRDVLSSDESFADNGRDTQIDPWTGEEIPVRMGSKPVRGENQSQENYDEALHQYELMRCRVVHKVEWPSFAWGLGIARWDEIPERARPMLSGYQSGWMTKSGSSTKTQTYQCGLNYAEYHENLVLEHDKRKSVGEIVWSQSELKALRSAKTVMTEECSAIDAEVARLASQTHGKDSVSSKTIEEYEQKLDIKSTIDAAWGLLCRDLAEAEEYIAKIKADEEAAKAAEVRLDHQQLVDAPRAISEVRTELLRRSRDCIVTHNDEVRAMNEKLHQSGAKACVVGAGPAGMRLVTPETVTRKDRLDAEKFNQHIDFGQ